MLHFTSGGREERIWSKADMDGYKQALEDYLQNYWPELKKTNCQEEKQ